MKVDLVLSLMWTIAISFAEANPTPSIYNKDLLSQNEAISSGRIANGKLVQEKEIPYIVALTITNTTMHKNGCGGSIISPEWILTAAHCLENAIEVAISYGTTDRENPLLVVNVDSSNFYNHPEYQFPKNDVALINTPHIEFNEKISNIQLPRQQSPPDNYIDEWANASGWGRTESKRYSSELYKADLKVISNKECVRYFAGVDDGMLCAKSPEFKSTCEGDSGGPLVLLNDNVEESTLIGVTSSGPANFCGSILPVVFARVTTYLDWIEEVSGVVKRY